MKEEYGMKERQSEGKVRNEGKAKRRKGKE